MNDKLIKIQSKLKAPKSEYNSYAKFSYRSAEGILEAVKPLIHAEGLTLIVSDEVVNIGTANYVKSTAMLSDGENTIGVSAYAREEESLKGQIAAQITGGASSYAKKYALNGLFAIDDTKDADHGSGATETPTPKPKSIINPLGVAKLQLQDMFKEYGHDNPVKMKVVVNTVLQKNTVDTVDEANEVMQALTDGLV